MNNYNHINIKQKITQKIAVGMVIMLLSLDIYAGDIIIPPRIHWIGPEVNCDYPTIQAALDDVFSCGFVACPLGINQLQLSANYQHSGQIIVDKTFNIKGGYESCEGDFTGIKTALSAVTPSTSRLFVIVPPVDNSITNVFSNLNMLGIFSNGIAQGGVIVMASGDATLKLESSNVSLGRADEGGGIAMRGNGNVLELLDTNISFNEAVPNSFGFGDGGGIYCENGGYINFISGDIHDNEADRRGGGMVLDNCQLNGNTNSQHRFIQNNTVLRSTELEANGQGGGIFATGNETTIQLGALMSQTMIANNRVVEWQPDTSQINRTSGGGLFLRLGASADLINVQFIANKAPDGGGISLETDSNLNMDRATGPCDLGQLQQCSAFIDNEATGDASAGSGSAIFASANNNGAFINIKRTIFRGNDAFEHNGDGGFGSMIRIDDSETIIEGNLMFLNSLDDDFSIIGSDRYGRYLSFIGGNVNLIQNTIAFNESSGSVLGIFGAEVNAVANLIFDPAQEFGIMDNDVSDQTIYSACNVTSDEVIDTIINGGENAVVSDPGFVDSMGANFRLAGSSPAVNRCDDELALDLITLQYDIDGRSRITNGQAGGFGPYDAGAYEFHFNLGQEVDLETHLELASNTGPIGAIFEVQLRNIGMNPALPNNTYINFEKPDVLYTTAGNWSCNEVDVNAITMVECKYQNTIAVLATSTKLTVEMAPDDQNDCQLQVIAESRGSTTTDTDLTNNSADIGTLTCGLQDLIFANGFD